MLQYIKNVEVKDESHEETTLDYNMKLLHNVRFHHITDINMVRIFLVLWLSVSIAAMVPLLRPEYSDIEKRELQKFPEFSFKALASGDYFDDINLWFSDTFPLRDNLVELNTYVTNGFGINRVQVHGDIKAGDDIPDIESSEQEITNEEESKVESSTILEPEPQLPAVERLGAILIVDNAAYEYYNFNQSASDNYSATVSKAADMLVGKSTVYDMIIPTSMEITLPEFYSGSTNSSDQKAAIDYMNSKMSQNVYKVDSYTTLMNHKDEYIYFRTDHHWTSLGAYYAYRELMAAKGAAPAELSAFTEHRFDGFLGSFYAESGQKPQLGNTPDTVFAYAPTQMQYIHTFLEGGGEANLNIVADGNALSASNKYLSFICGDHPYGIMTNPNITEETSCLVIKESFGNAMVAYLTQHYRNVYVVDYRYISKVYPNTLNQFVDERGINDIIFINNISATRSPALMCALSAFVG